MLTYAGADREAERLRREEHEQRFQAYKALLRLY
jgi:hypothetical protein